MLRFIPFEDDWDALEHLRPEDLIPYRVGLLTDMAPPVAGSSPASGASSAPGFSSAEAMPGSQASESEQGPGTGA